MRAMKTILTIVLCSQSLFATTYCVSNSGSDAASGTATGPLCTGVVSAWQTVARVNAQTFLNPADSVLFQRGGAWHEWLQIPASGTPGNLISFGAYGTGANPIISGADLITGPWTQDSVAPLDTQTFASGGLSGSYWTNNSCTFPTSPVQGASTHSLQCATSSSLQTTSAPNSNVIEIDAYFQISASTATTGNKTRIMFMEGSAWNSANGVGVWVDLSGSQYRLSVGRGSAIGATTFNITVGTWYQLRFLVSSNSGNSTDSGKLYANGSLVSSLTGLSLTSPVNSEFHLGSAGAFNAVFTMNFDSLNVYNQDSTILPSRWFATLTTQPYVVLFNENAVTAIGANPQASGSAVTAPLQWFWGANTLYVYSVNNPNSDYTSPGLQAGQRQYTITRNGKSYFSLSNLITEGASDSNINGGVFIGQTGPGDSGEAVGVVINNIEARFNGKEGLWLDSVNGSISNSYFHDNRNMGIDFDTGANMTGTNLRSDNNQYGSYPGSIFAGISGLTLNNFEASGNAQNGLVLSIGATYTINNCSLHDNVFNGLYLDGTTVTGATIAGCSIYRNGDAGIRIDPSGATNIALQYNTVYNNTNTGLYDASGTNSVTAYNNTFYHNGTDFLVTGSGTVINSRNNIGNSATVLEGSVAASASGTQTVDYNDWLTASPANFMSWHGSASGFIAWQIASSLDVHSISADPLFTNAVAADFRLQPGSPAVNTGVCITGITPCPTNIGALGVRTPALITGAAALSGKSALQ